MITIIKWTEFENADTRKRQRLGWFLAPSGCDSRGYRQLMRSGRDGLAALGVFQALCQLMATMPKKHRGHFANSDGTSMEVADIWELSRISPADGQAALPLLAEIQWLSVTDAACVPPACHPSPGFVKGEGEGEGEGEGAAPAPTRHISTPTTEDLIDLIATFGISGLSPAWTRSWAAQFLAVWQERQWQTNGGRNLLDHGAWQHRLRSDLERDIREGKHRTAPAAAATHEPRPINNPA